MNIQIKMSSFTCLACQINKDISEYTKTCLSRTGSQYYRRQCRSCVNIKVTPNKKRAGRKSLLSNDMILRIIEMRKNGSTTREICDDVHLIPSNYNRYRRAGKFD
jgi:hypothetical protein